MIPCVLVACAAAQQEPEPWREGRIAVAVEGATREYPYRLLTPPPSPEDPLYPLVVFLHGAGERGSDNVRQLAHFGRRIAGAEYRERFPCFVLALQCPRGEQWVDVPWNARVSPAQPEQPARSMQAVIAALQELMREHPIDPDCVYLTGLSMGGYGAWDLATRQPDWFAAVVPICGGGDVRAASRLCGVPVWAWHGAADRAVPVARSREMVEAIRAAGGEPRFSELAGVGHDSWSAAYASDGALPWLFEQRRDLAVRAGAKPGAALPQVSGDGDVVELALEAPAPITAVILEEESAALGRVQSHVVEFLAGDAWRELARGGAIGPGVVHRFAATECARLRVRVMAGGADAPRLRRFAVVPH